MLWLDATTELPQRSYVTADGCRVFPQTVVARTGIQDYAAFELAGADVEPDTRGWISVRRDASEVFHPRAVASFRNVPITLGHVDEGQAEHYAVGRVLNPRRIGDHLVADLRICDAEAQRLIMDRNWRGISCGYECGYQSLGPGRARQVGIVGDHVAVLGDGAEPRCGEACRINDSTGRPTMRTRDQGMQSILGSTQMGRSPGGKVGPAIVLALPGPASAYGIFEAEGHAIVVEHGHADRTIDPGDITTDAATRRQINARVRSEQAAGRAYADRVKQFWESQRAR
jgi:hypothetical protein